MSNQLQLVEFHKFIDKSETEISNSLPSHIPAKRFVRTLKTAVATNPDLLNVDKRSVLLAASKAAQQGLLPDGREGAIVSFGGKAQWMPMVAGLMKLVRNSGEISSWSVQAVYENDEFDYSLGDEEYVKHKPALSGRGDKVIAVYSIVTLKDGEKSRDVMSVDDIEAIRKRSRSPNGGPWKTDYAEMAKKSVVRRHAKRLPMSTDLDDVLREDAENFQSDDTHHVTAPVSTTAAAPKKRTRLAEIVETVDEETGEIDTVQAEVEDDSPI